MATTDPFACLNGPMFEAPQTSEERQIMAMFSGQIILKNKRELVMTVPVTKLIEKTRPLREFTLKNVQRDIDHLRVEKMSLAQQETYKKTGTYPIASTIIILGRCEQASTDNNPLGLRIIDGQHRRGVWVDLNKVSPEICATQLTLVKVCKFASLLEMEEAFRVINDNWVPINKYYLRLTVREVADGVATWMKKTYGSTMFRTSSTPQRPHINLEHVCKCLSETPKVLSLIDQSDNDTAQTIKVICLSFKRYNDYLGQIAEDEPGALKEGRETMKSILKRIEKCNASDVPCFLGLESDCAWISHALDMKPDEPEESETEESETEESETEESTTDTESEED